MNKRARVDLDREDIYCLLVSDISEWMTDCPLPSARPAMLWKVLEVQGLGLCFLGRYQEWTTQSPSVIEQEMKQQLSSLDT